MLYEDWDLIFRVALALYVDAARFGIILDGISDQKRAGRVYEVLSKTKPWPAAFQELAERLYADRQLKGRIWAAIRRHRLYLQACQRDVAGDIFEATRERILFVVLRNAKSWLTRPERGDSWWGCIDGHIDQILQREYDGHFPETPDPLVEELVAKWAPCGPVPKPLLERANAELVARQGQRAF